MRPLDDDLDPLGWAKRPRSREALALLRAGAKNDTRLRDILAGHVRDGVVTEEGAMLFRWNTDAKDWVRV